MSHNEEMNLAWQFIANTGVSVFLTGKAGTGKTTFLRRLREQSPKRMVVLAPTGVAAINAGGQTIHSFFQLPFGPFIPGQKSRGGKHDFMMSQQKKNLIRTLDLLVIDEISMVRADMLDQIDDAMRKYRDRSRPFGGVQLLLIGDLMQLSPVAKSDEWAMLSEHYDSPYFFSSHALKLLPYVTVELKHIYRQQDESFISLLSKVRDGHITDDVVNMLNTRYITNFHAQGDDWIRLTTHNLPAQQYNEMRMAQLPDVPHVFSASVHGDFPELSYPADAQLTLKLGAQVMFVKNDPSIEHAYYNGKIGIVKGFNDGSIEVVCDNGSESITVTPVVWENTKYAIDPNTKQIKEDVVGTFTQYPLRLAWAITVHKSQGLTFDHAVLDINASFAHGQVYVALSRCRTLEGMVLSNPLLIHSVITDMTVNTYIDNVLGEAATTISRLDEFKYQYTLSLLDELYSFATLSTDCDWLTRVVDEYLSRQQPQLLQTLKDTVPQIKGKLTDVSMRFARQYKTILESTGFDINNPSLTNRIKESAVYFSRVLHSLFDNLLDTCVINIENKAVAKIYSNALDALKQSVSTKCMLFDRLVDMPFSTQCYLNLKAQALLSGADSTSTRNRKVRAKKTVAPKEKKPKKPDTLVETLQLYQSGLNAAQIAKQRGLVESTIYKHLATLVGEGKIDINGVVPEKHQRLIRDAVKTFKSTYTLSDLKQLLPPEITYGEIRIVLQSKTVNKP